jgi:hypothetical protein
VRTLGFMPRYTRDVLPVASNATVGSTAAAKSSITSLTTGSARCVHDVHYVHA